MICIRCGNQCIQYKGLGSGSTDLNFTDTIEIKHCTHCNTKFVECRTIFEISGRLKAGDSYIQLVVSNIKKLILKFQEHDR